MFDSVIWAFVVLYLLWRLEVLYKNWLKNKEPLGQIQYKELNQKISEMQIQVNSLAVQKEYD